MTTLTDALSKVSDYLWKPVNIELSYTRVLGQPVLPDNLLLFDIRLLKENEEAMWFIGDLYGDLSFEELLDDGSYQLYKNLKSCLERGLIPFGFIDLCLGLEGGEFGEGNFDTIVQPSKMLLVDTKKGEGDTAAVYSITIDGTFLRKSFTKVANDISELKLNHGLIEEEDDDE